MEVHRFDQVSKRNEMEVVSTAESCFNGHAEHEASMNKPNRLIVGISGASGVAYGIRALELLRELGVESHLVVTPAAHITRSQESSLSARELENLADVSYSVSNIGAAIASGSFKTLGMLIAPCSVHTLSELAYGNTGSLITRAADVCLKERRRVVLLFRETPLHAGHLHSMLRVTDAGAVVMPPVPAFYTNPVLLDDVVTQTIARALDLFGLDAVVPRWTGLRPAGQHLCVPSAEVAEVVDTSLTGRG